MILGWEEEKKWRRLIHFLLHSVVSSTTRGLHGALYFEVYVSTLGIVWQLYLGIQGLTNGRVSLAFLKRLTAYTLTAARVVYVGVWHDYYI